MRCPVDSGSCSRVQNSLFNAPRFVPHQFGRRPVRRLRSSINIATFPGRKARTVSRFNLIAPRGAQRADAAAVVADRRKQ